MDWFGRPDHLVETHPAAMQVVLAIVLGQRIGLAVELELAPGDPVAVASHQAAEVRTLGKVSGQVVVAEHDVAQLALTIRNQQRPHDPAVGGDGRAETVAIGQAVEVHRGSVWCPAKGHALDAGLGSSVRWIWDFHACFGPRTTSGGRVRPILVENVVSLLFAFFMMNNTNLKD